MANFEDLSDDIMYLILNLFSSNRLHMLRCFRLVSKRLNSFADSVLYRNIVLEENDESQEQMSYRFIERLLDPLDVLRCHVRSLHVRSFEGDERSSCMNNKLLLACLRSIHKLQWFSWSNKIPLPDDLLHALHKDHPGAHLCLSSRQLDQVAFSSPQLHRLIISIPYSDIVSPISVAPFEQLKRGLVNNQNVRALTIDIHQDFDLRQAAEAAAQEIGEGPKANRAAMSGLDSHRLSIRGVHAGHSDEMLRSSGISNEIQMRLDPKDRLPTLEEFAIKAITYKFDREHCVQLLKCMDWTDLKRLRLGSCDTASFFEAFTSKLPLLQHLDFSICSHLRKHFFDTTQASPVGQANLAACVDFIASVRALRSLVVRSNLIDFSDRFWHILAITHGQHLQHLSMQPQSEYFEAPTYLHSMRNILSFFTSLTRLELAMSKVDGACSRCLLEYDHGHALSTDYVSNIPFLPTLKMICISVRLSPINEWSLQRYIAHHAHCAILKIWTLFVNQPELGDYEPIGEDVPFDLRVVSINFWRWETPSAHAEKIGTSPVAHIKTVMFDSMTQEDQLVIRAREGQKSVKTYYDIYDSGGSHYVDAHRWQRSWCPAKPSVPGLPFILPEWFHDAQ